ncbi:DciA family protein [Streptomyces sp. NBC_00057]|uniref:DciA family protein n=1 Tax=Streptomyces sp. NBC_00057 TaxID=2975634 RepID=UPI002F918B31
MEPLGVDAQMRLHVLCESPAWRTQLQLIGKPVLTRINEIVPEARLTGLLAHMRPRILVLVVATDNFADEQLVSDVLLETCYDVIEAFGPEHQVALKVLGESAFDHHVGRWAAAHTSATAGVSAPLYGMVHLPDHAEHGEGATWVRDRSVIAEGPQLCLAFCAPGAPLPAITQLATGAGIPVRRLRREGPVAELSPVRTTETAGEAGTVADVRQRIAPR